jgi:hypothetical protein
MIGVFLIATFPLVGNAIAFRNSFDRRYCQIIVLVLALLILGKSLFRLAATAFQDLYESRKKKPILLIFAIAGILILTSAYKWISYSGPLQSSRWIDLSVTVGWLFFFAVALVRLPLRPIFDLKPSPIEATAGRAVVAALGSISLFLVWRAWSQGPDVREVYMSFNGSTIVTGVCASIGAFTVLWLKPGWRNVLILAGFMYVMVMSTARTIFILGLVFLGIWFFRLIFVFKAPAKKVLVQGVVPLLIYLGLLILPVFTTSHYYPYWIREDQPLANPVYNRMEYWRRSARLLRILPFTHVLPGTNKFMMMGMTFDEAELNALGGDLGEVAMKQVHAYDPRGLIYWKTFLLSLKRPLGYWPEPYSQYIEYTCGGGVPCLYPHNFLLESAFYFGWMMGILFFLCFSWVLLYVVWDVLSSRADITVVPAIALLAFFIQIQISGNLMDTVIPLCIGFHWLLNRRAHA